MPSGRAVGTGSTCGWNRIWSCEPFAAKPHQAGLGTRGRTRHREELVDLAEQPAVDVRPGGLADLEVADIEAQARGRAGVVVHDLPKRDLERRGGGVVAIAGGRQGARREEVVDGLGADRADGRFADGGGEAGDGRDGVGCAGRERGLGQFGGERDQVARDARGGTGAARERVVELAGKGGEAAAVDGGADAEAGALLMNWSCTVSAWATASPAAIATAARTHLIFIANPLTYLGGIERGEGTRGPRPLQVIPWKCVQIVRCAAGTQGSRSRTAPGRGGRRSCTSENGAMGSESGRHGARSGRGALLAFAGNPLRRNFWWSSSGRSLRRVCRPVRSRPLRS